MTSKERERSYGIHEARKHRNGCVSNLPRLHGVRGRATLDSQMGAERRKQPADHQESPRAGINFFDTANVYLDLFPGEPFPGHIRLIRWIAIHATHSSFFHMIVSTSAFEGFLDNPNISDLRLVPAHRIYRR